MDLIQKSNSFFLPPKKLTVTSKKTPCSFLFFFQRKKKQNVVFLDIEDFGKKPQKNRRFFGRLRIKRLGTEGSVSRFFGRRPPFFF
jgi:hypothetical protein